MDRYGEENSIREREVSMKSRAPLILSGLALVLGLALMIGGILTAKHGAVVIGMGTVIVASFSLQQYLRKNKARNDERVGHAP